MPATLYNLLIEQGSRFQRALTIKSNGVLKPLDGFLGQAQIRKSYGDAIALVQFTVEIDPLISKIYWNLTSIQTALLPSTCKPSDVPRNFQTKSLQALPPKQFVWDLTLIDPTGERDRILQGAVLITPGVTR